MKHDGSLFATYGYSGMPEPLLLSVCGRKCLDKGIAPKQYGITEMYSQGSIFREYSGFPSWLPLGVCADHGAGDACALQSEIQNDAYAMFAFSHQKRVAYEKVSKKPCFLAPNPFIWYRRMHKISLSEDAKGTIAFPCHSLDDVRCVFDVHGYIEKLKSLPGDMQPVCVCMFTVDVLKGLYKPFVENGIAVYSAGNISDVRFVERYYEILRHFRYSTSNSPGSYLFYSIEMGIPFSIVGDDVELINDGNTDLPTGQVDIQSFEYEKMGRHLFSGIHRVVTPAQKAYVDEYIPQADSILSPSEMRDILFAAWRNREHPCFDAMIGLRRLAKRKIRGLLCGKRGLWN